MQDALGSTISFQFDALDRVIHSTDAVGAGRTFGYDTMGRLTSATEPLAHAMSMTYDARGLLASSFDVNSETDLTRTPLGEVSQVTDPNRHGWPATYDADGRMQTAADPLARTTSLGYDARGRLVHAQLPMGSEDKGLDAAGRLMTLSFADGTVLAYSYDDANRPTGGTSAAFEYDAAGNMILSNGLAFTRDAEGRITSETYSQGKAVLYTYDGRGLLGTVTDWVGGTTTFAYDTTGALTGLLRPNGTQAGYQYDAARRPTQILETVTPGPPGLASITITRDALGRPMSTDRSQPLMPTVGASGAAAFGYDAASQITGYAYDPLGRLISDGSRTFLWDGASRLTGFTSSGEAPTFTYDAFGNPLSRTQGAASEQYRWNYANAARTLDVTLLGGTPRTYYVHTPSGMLLESIDASSGARSFYHYDESEGVRFLVGN